MSFLKYLRRHPFPVIARFERVVAVSFAFPEPVLRPLVPDALEIDTYEGFGFFTVALVWTKKLRPAGFPSFRGSSPFRSAWQSGQVGSSSSFVPSLRTLKPVIDFPFASIPSTCANSNVPLPGPTMR
jgi:hypothetical protein